MKDITSPPAKQPGDWHREDIKAAIRKSGITMQALSRRAGLSVNALALAMIQPWPRAQAVIADRIGVAPHIIWPSRYDKAGRPLRGIRGAFGNDIAGRRAAHSQKPGRS